MPWKETGPVEERMKFVAAVLEGDRSISSLCDAFGVSRKSAYKWLGRYQTVGPEGLLDRSRAPRSSPQRIDAAVEQLVVAIRRRHPTWGPKKIAAYMASRAPGIALPALSTIGTALVRHELVRKRRLRSRQVGYAMPLERASAPNDIWCVDFKGDFRTGDGQRCHPLTMTDAFSRFLLCCKALRSTRAKPARDEFEEVFREYGLPRVIRSDNGVPFASTGGLSALAVWWIKLGIWPERIEPGKPQQNGAHERMHRTLKAETARPPRASSQAQQRVFDAFVKTYNTVRPHEALQQRPPASLYRASARLLPRYVPEPQYPNHYEVRRVNSSGRIKLHGEDIFVTHSLRLESIGLEPLDDGLWGVHFGMMRFGSLDERIRKVDKRIELGTPKVSPMSPV